MLSRVEVFSNIESQIERAIQLGQDNVVEDLDREIDPLLEDILLYKATNTMELFKQLKFITDLLERRSDDAATVVRLSAKMSELLSRYFHEGQLRLDRGLGIRPAVLTVPLAAREDDLGCVPAVSRVAVVSMDQRFLYCNSVMAEDLGASPRTLIGRPIAEFVDMDVFESFYRPHFDVCMAGDFREFQAPLLSGGPGVDAFHIRLTPLRNIERRITGSVIVAQATAPEMAEVGH